MGNVTPLPRQPAGDKMVKSLGPGNLNKGAGKEARRLGTPVYCGAISGVAYGVLRRQNRLDATKQSVAFLGKFLAVTSDGEVIRPMELYLPGILENSLAAMTEKSEAVQFAFEVWAEPDETPSNQIGYRYAVRQRMKEETDPALELAYQAGILDRPAPQIEHIADPEAPDAPDYDPETGEVFEAAPAPAAKRGKG